MESLEIKLLDMLKMNKSMYEINKELGTSNDDIYKILFDIKSKYSEFKSIINDGIVQYTNFYNLFGNNNTYLNVGEFRKLKIMIVSDLHLGHYDDLITSVDLMYDYVVKNNINIIFNLGDFFEGYSIYKTCKFSDCDKQITYALNNYPHDKSVINFLLLGNHDISLVLDKGIDIKKIITDKRDDIVITGIGRANLFLNNFRFRLDHQTNRYPVEPAGCFNNGIIAKGHSHMYKIISGSTYISIHAPNLSNIMTSKYSCRFPSMLEMTLHVNDSIINNVTLKHFAVWNNEIVSINEHRMNICIEHNDKFLDKQFKQKKLKI